MADLFGPPPGAIDHVIGLDDLDPFAYAGQTTFSGSEWSIFDGGKFLGGFGETQIQQLDYWTLRARSAQLFNENLYAKGLVRRLITNEINTGLTPEASPAYQPEPEPPVLSNNEVEPAPSPIDIDWLSVGLGLLALIAVGGLVPFCMWVYFQYNPPIR